MKNTWLIGTKSTAEQCLENMTCVYKQLEDYAWKNLSKKYPYTSIDRKKFNLIFKKAILIKKKE